MTTTTTHPSRTISRWTGAALLTAMLGFFLTEAIVASAWDERPYSYADDYVSFLGSRYTGTFEGYSISSPLWMLMDVGWIASGALIATAVIRIARQLPRRRGIVVTVLAACLAAALIVFALVPLGPETVTQGLLPLYLVAAFLSIIAGNGLAIAIGLSWSLLRLPRRAGIAGTVLGVVGLASIPATYGWLAIGIAERIPMYSFLLWAAITGSALIRTRHTSAPDHTAHAWAPRDARKIARSESSWPTRPGSDAR